MIATLAAAAADPGPGTWDLVTYATGIVVLLVGAWVRAAQAAVRSELATVRVELSTMRELLQLQVGQAATEATEAKAQAGGLPALLERALHQLRTELRTEIGRVESTVGALRQEVVGHRQDTSTQQTALVAQLSDVSARLATTDSHHQQLHTALVSRVERLEDLTRQGCG